MTKVIVGFGTCGIAAGAEETYRALTQKLSSGSVDVELAKTGCIGMCYQEPLVEIADKRGRQIYGKVSADKIDRLLDECVAQGKTIDEWLVWSEDKGTDLDFLARQKRIALRNCGNLDPENIDEYLAKKGYEALRKVIEANDPAGCIATMIESGLRGRGGAGFLTGQKWKFTAQSKGERKFIICNGDEGDPGAFMDRSVLESDPHSVLEGMAIAAHSIGASEGYLYVRAEYPLAIKRLITAIKQAEDRHMLGDNIFGSGFSFHIKLKEGAGAFVCGEETALIASIEGRRGMPRVRPPFPAVKGLWEYPTNINNVETYANVPWIILNGASAFNSLGTANSKGTKVFAMAGKIKRGGLVEVPMGITIKDIVFDICGGIKNDRKFKAVQMGGPSGGCIPAELMNTVIDYDSIGKTGAIMGSGGLVVMDDTMCMVEVARFFLDFTQRESCGKCTFCRLGTKRMLEILTRITEGKGKEGDIELLEDLAARVKATSLCGLGQSAPNPVLTTIKYFRSEYEAHINNKKCPAHYCHKLLKYEITDACTGCTLCARKCPTSAISGEKQKKHRIDQTKCISCGECYKACRFAAIHRD